MVVLIRVVVVVCRIIGNNLDGTLEHDGGKIRVW